MLFRDDVCDYARARPVSHVVLYVLRYAPPRLLSSTRFGRYELSLPTLWRLATLRSTRRHATLATLSLPGARVALSTRLEHVLSRRRLPLNCRDSDDYFPRTLTSREASHSLSRRRSTSSTHLTFHLYSHLLYLYSSTSSLSACPTLTLYNSPL